MSPKTATPESRARRRPSARIVLLAVVVAVLVGLAVPLVATSTPDFFARYHLLNRRYVNLEDSAHVGIGCRDCHQKEAFENGVQLTADYYASLFRDDEEPLFFAFGPPRKDACLKCHEDVWSSKETRIKLIPHPAHTRLAAETRECVDCHKWTAHLENYMEKHKKMPFSGVCVQYGCHVGTKQSDQCFDCHHVLHEDAKEWTQKHPAVARKTGQNACLESCHEIAQCQLCHTTGKTPQFSGRPVQVGMEAIEELHVAPDWTARYHGAEAIKDRKKCLLCHQTTGECDECHRNRPAFHGEVTAWIGRHSKSSDTVDDPRCLECHKKPWCEECHQQFKEME